MAKVSIMRVLIGLAAMVMLLEVATAVDHAVGSTSGGWNTNSDLDSWSSAQTFTVGDNLVFNFGPTHDVLEVRRADYDSCGVDNPISTTVTSPASFPLSATGTRYFICGRGTHCSQGMKVQVNVAAATSPSTPTTPSTPSTPSSPTAPEGSPTTPSPTGTTVEPPSSAISLKATAGTMLGFGFLVMMLL